MIRPTKRSEIKRNWHLVDAKGQILGRFASKLVSLLIGKGKSYFSKNLDCGDYVVVINAKRIVVTGKKEQKKKYLRYSGFPGDLKKSTFVKTKAEYPDRIIRQAVLGMLPKNKLRSGWMKRLSVFPEGEHTYKDKFNINSS